MDYGEERCILFGMGHGSVRVGAYVRAVDHHFFLIAILTDGLKHTLPYAGLGPP